MPFAHDNPHLHHIDENPANNANENLLPLCPNCHLIDQHNPTAPMDRRKLSLFRRYKDPSILSAQFEPLFRRFTFLLELDFAKFETRATVAKVKELGQFIQLMAMGEFYAGKVTALIKKPAHARAYSLNTPRQVFEKWAEEERKEFFEKLTANSAAAIELIIESLRFQSWNPDWRQQEKSG